MFRRSVIPAVTTIALCTAVGSARAQGTDSTHASTKSVLQGVFTDEQAARGDAEHQANCTACHSTTNYSGAAFAKTWAGRTAFDLFDQLRTTMPEDNPGGLSAQQYTDIVAYIFKINGLPAGAEPLSTDPEALRLIRIEVKPDSQFVRGVRGRAAAPARTRASRLRPLYFPHAPVSSPATR